MRTSIYFHPFVRPNPNLNFTSKKCSSLCWLKTYSGPHNAIYTSTPTHPHPPTCMQFLNLVSFTGCETLHKAPDRKFTSWGTGRENRMHWSILPETSWPLCFKGLFFNTHLNDKQAADCALRSFAWGVGTGKYLQDTASPHINLKTLSSNNFFFLF